MFQVQPCGLQDVDKLEHFSSAATNGSTSVICEPDVDIDPDDSKFRSFAASR